MPETELPLNVLLSKRCNYRCPFCVENTDRLSGTEIGWQSLVKKINEMDNNELLKDTSLLGGEPLYFPGIIELIGALKSKPIITTNGYRLVNDASFRGDFLGVAERVKALNISLPHYEQEKRATLSGTGRSFSNEQLKEVVATLGGKVNIRINTLLMRGYIDSFEEIEKMIAFTREMGVKELKIGELTAKDAAIHGFINQEVTRFNGEHYLPIPVEELYKKCHENGETSMWKEENGVKVFFNAPPDELMAGGKDKNGNYYQRILFEDGALGFSWNKDEIRQ